MTPMRNWLACLPTLVVLLGGAAFADPAHDFITARAELAKHTDEAGFLDDDPRTPMVIRRVWGAAETVARSSGSEAQAEATLASLDKDMSVFATQLDPSSLLFGLSINGIGDVFIVEHGVVAWRLGDTPAAGSLKPLLAWDLRASKSDCAEKHPDTDTWYACSPLGVTSLGRLPDGAAGLHRFWIDAAYVQAAGETDSGQISFWAWDGAHAKPLMLHIFEFHIELDGGPTLAGHLLSLPVKDEFNSFFSCGACEGRQRVWRFEATPSGIRDLGKVSKVPELDLIDSLYSRAFTHQPLGSRAVPAAQHAIEASAERADHSRSMSDGWALSADRRRLCFSTDAGGAMLFTLRGTRTGPVVASARPLGDDGCGDLVHWPGATSGS